jgi:hypothetical protein
MTNRRMNEWNRSVVQDEVLTARIGRWNYYWQGRSSISTSNCRISNVNPYPIILYHIISHYNTPSAAHRTVAFPYSAALRSRLLQRADQRDSTVRCVPRYCAAALYHILLYCRSTAVAGGQVVSEASSFFSPHSSFFWSSYVLRRV